MNQPTNKTETKHDIPMQRSYRLHWHVVKKCGWYFTF